MFASVCIYKIGMWPMWPQTHLATEQVVSKAVDLGGHWTAEQVRPAHRDASATPW